ncbi:endospore germination permease [Brevibacillus choshinensis]|uniref:endospore germination permease n=1 Tax=Brevibacillus choshinensis TaxID=54911 RepID=UPI002E200F01|nr:endospore germination permease [Brevibacillus choshinensis]MED4752691.1 endospore germination permease [Brevibacillus choshinensis]
MNNGSVTFFQAVCMLMLTIGLMSHVIVIPVLLDAAKRDSWISVLLAGAFFIVWSTLLYSVVAKTRQQNLFLLLKKAYPSAISYMLAGIACVYLFVMCAITMRDTITWIHVAFSPKMPILFIALLLACICLGNAYLGIRSIANTAAIFLPLVIALGFYVMTANYTHKSYILLKPFLEYGMLPVWKGVVFVGAGFVELIILLFMQQHIRVKYSLLSLLMLALILIGLTFGPVTGAISEFGVGESEKLRYPAYEEWRLVNIGRYIEHMDFLSIYQWFSGAFIRMSLTMFLIVDILRIQSNRKRLFVLAVLFSLLIAVSVLPYSDNAFLDVLTAYLLPLMFYVMVGYSLIIVVLVNWASRRRGMNDAEKKGE